MSFLSALKSAAFSYLLLGNPQALSKNESSNNNANDETSVISGNQGFCGASHLSVPKSYGFYEAEGFFSQREIEDLQNSDISYAFESSADKKETRVISVSNRTSRIYQPPLIKAIKSNNVDEVRKLISSGEDVNHLSVLNDSPFFVAPLFVAPLFVAIEEQGNLDIVRELINAKADVSWRSSWDTKPFLFKAIELGNIDIIRELIEAGADVNYKKSRFDRSFLLKAIELGDIDIIRVLIEAGADVEPVKTCYFWSPALIKALKQKDFQRIREEILHLSESYFLKNPEEKLELNSWTDPQIIKEYNLQSLDSDDSDDGRFKKAFIVPENQRSLIEGLANKNLVVLIFKENRFNYSPKVIQEYMKTSLSQYKEVKRIFGSDRCVNIYNSETALEQKCLIVEKIPQSLINVLIDLQKKGLQAIESKDSLDENQQIALDLLRQLNDFYDFSIKKGIDGDLHIGNFRVKIDESNNYKLILTDFSESFDEDDFLASKRFQFSMFKKALGTIFTNKFLEDYFAESLKTIR